MASNFSISVSGIQDAVKKLDAGKVESEMDRLTETYARKMANTAEMKAPRKDGFLKASIGSSPKRESKGVWSWGSDLPYALRQEYEHATQRGFVRSTIWQYRVEYRAAVKTLLKGLGG